MAAVVSWRTEMDLYLFWVISTMLFGDVAGLARSDQVSFYCGGDGRYPACPPGGMRTGAAVCHVFLPASAGASMAAVHTPHGADQQDLGVWSWQGAHLLAI